jgi:FkbM family methyltransferase
MNILKEDTMQLIGTIKRRIWSMFFKNARLCYSQSGEDMILDTIFYNTQKGVYVDIGANNPYIQSNTHYFYKKGWRGFNIDALPGSMNKFKKVRGKDINIEAAISNESSDLTYYTFSSSFYNTFEGKDIARLKTFSKLTGQIKIRTIKLSELFDSLKIKNIDFMSLDVEGLDLEVLKSNDWQKYRPKVLVVESVAYSYSPRELDHITNIKTFLESVGYKYFCNSPINAFYIEIEFYKERFEEVKQNI